MSETDETLTTAESYVERLHDAMTAPGDRECLACYLLRMLGEFGCDGSHRWVERWRADQAPRATSLLGRLGRQGGCCDCEVAMNVYPDRLPEDGTPPLPCSLVTRRGSTKPCRRDGPYGSQGTGWWA
jgi:hypothetical protein